ncbi:MAG: FkbM family methyltransferase [Acidimicrobiia bacterium]|nr:FkbM family methyltransferase [Acidimicrobiia bacterium]
MKRSATLLQRLTRALQTKDPRVGRLGRLARAVAYVPVFGSWWALAVAYSRFRHTISISGETLDGFKFECRLPDLVEMYIYLFGIWEPDLSVFVHRSLSPGRTFIDVGAHVGYFAVLGADAVGPTGSVVAIEANPDTFPKLMANITSNCGPVVRCVEALAGEREGDAVLYPGPARNSGLATILPSRGLKEGRSVHAGTPRSLLSESEINTARLVKIDVEGAEPEVLRGFAELLTSFPTDVEFVVEISPHWWTEGESIEKVLRPFVDAGFRVYEIDNNYWPWRYLWPRRTSAPRLRSASTTKLTGRADLVLSRRDTPTL